MSVVTSQRLAARIGQPYITIIAKGRLMMQWEGTRT